MISGNDKEACVRELRPTRRTLFCFYFHICMHTLHKQPIHLYRRAQINTVTVEMITHTHTHWSQSRAASYQVGDGWRMRSVLRGIQTLWKRPVVVSECVCVSLLRCSPLMISSTHSQSFSNLHTGAHRGENAAGDSLLEELHNVSMLICDQDGCE